MRDEVEEFLRRVAQARAQAEAQARGQQPRPATPPVPPQRQFPPQGQAPPQRLVPAREEVVYLQPAEPEIVDAELAEADERIGRGVTQSFRGVQEISQHASQLGAEVDLADDKLEARLHQVFDHQVGRLQTSATDIAAEAPSDAKRSGFTAESVVNLLRSPDHLRNAIVLGEILRRPEHHW